MFQQQERMARLNAELRGYTTGGSAYGLNQASGFGQPGSSAPPPSSGGVGPNDPNFTPGTFNAGTNGLGYGEPRAQAKMKTSTGESTEFGTTPGTTANLSDLNTDIQPFEHRNTGAARNIGDSEADQWLNRNVVNASREVQPVKPASRITTGVGMGGSRVAGSAGLAEAGAAAGPAGMVAGLLAEEVDKSMKAMQSGGSSIGRALAGR